MTDSSAEDRRNIWLVRLLLGAGVLIAAFILIRAIADPPTVEHTGGDVEYGAINSSDGFVRFDLSNVGSEPVEIRELNPTAAGLLITGVQFPDGTSLQPGDSINVTILAEVTDCDLVPSGDSIKILAERQTIFDRVSGLVTGPTVDGLGWSELLASELCG